MRYDEEEQISILECLADAIRKGIFNCKEGCRLCQDKKVCRQIVGVLKEGE